MIIETDLNHRMTLKLPYTMKIEKHSVERLIVSLEDMEHENGIERIGKFCRGYHFNEIMIPEEIKGSEKETQLLDRIDGHISMGALRVAKIIYI